jgi:hypothetical protein
MASLIQYLTRIENTWQYMWLDTCLHDKEFEIACSSLFTGHMTWAIYFMIRNTPIMYCKEFLLNVWLRIYVSLKDIYSKSVKIPRDISGFSWQIIANHVFDSYVINFLFCMFDLIFSSSIKIYKNRNSIFLKAIIFVYSCSQFQIYHI